MAALERAITDRGAPGKIRSDNGSEFISKLTRQYLQDKGIKTLYIEPGSPWQNPYVESFHNRLRDECLNQEWFLCPWQKPELSSRTGATNTIEFTLTATSDFFPQI